MTDEPSRENVASMFNLISKKYDRINRILSFGMDQRWRKRVLKYLPKQDNLILLDLACGTADQIISILDHSHQIDEAIGVDPAEKMLEIGREKIRDKFYRSKVKLLEGSGENIPVKDRSIDIVTISFGIRNVRDIPKTFQELQRVLKPGGKLLILEFSLPEVPWIQKGHLFYLRKILPFIGGTLSKSRKSYAYLNKTIETFPYGKAFCSVLKKHGFEAVRCHSMCLGAVSLYEGLNQ